MFWSADENDYLRKHAASMTINELHDGLAPLSARIGTTRSMASIYRKSKKLGVTIKIHPYRGTPRVWTPEKLQYLKDSYKKKPQEELVRHLGVSHRSILKKVREIGLRSGKLVRETPWKEHLMDIYAVAEWLDEHGIETTIKSKGREILMAVFRYSNAGYTDPPMAVYNRLEKEGKLGGRLDINTFDEEDKQTFAGYKNFNVHHTGRLGKIEFMETLEYWETRNDE